MPCTKEKDSICIANYKSSDRLETKISMVDSKSISNLNNHANRINKL